MRRHHRRRLGDGREVDVGRNFGVRKVCGCPRRDWGKCPHDVHGYYQHNKKSHRFSLSKLLGHPITSLVEGRQEMDRIRQAIRAGTFERDYLRREPSVLAGEPVVDNTQPPQGGPSSTLRKAVEDYLETFVDTPLRRPEAKSEMTRLMRAWLISPLPDGSTLADVPLVQITAADITRVVDTRHAREKPRGDKAGRVGTNRMLSRLRHFYRWSIRRGWAVASPFEDQPGRPGVQFVKGVEQPRTRRLRDGELAKLLEAANPHTRVLIVAALDTCCRVGELLALTFDDVDDERDVLRIKASSTKTGEGREVPMTARVKAIIAMRRTAPDGREHPGSAFVFGNAVGEQIREHKTAWLACCRRSKVEGLHFHDLRREGASRLLEAGVALNVVSAWLGHSSVAQTSTYLSINTPQLQEARKKLEAALKAADEAAKKAAQKETTDAPESEQNPPLDDTACKELASSAELDSMAELTVPVTATIH